MRPCKFSPFDWKELKDVSKTRRPHGGRVWLRATQEVACFVQAVDENGEVFETLLAVAKEIDALIPDGMVYYVECPDGVRVWAYQPQPFVQQPDVMAFTNADRMPHESGNVLAVTAGLRQLELARRAALRDITFERRELERARARAAAHQQLDNEAIAEDDEELGSAQSEQAAD